MKRSRLSVTSLSVILSTISYAQTEEAEVVCPGTIGFAQTFGKPFPFPSAGCWQITGQYLGQKLVFVVEVRPE